jgi:predicted acetyltransferase
VSIRIRQPAGLSEYGDALRNGIGHYVGWEPSEEDCEQLTRILPFDRMLAAFDSGHVVAAAGVMPMRLHVPGRAVDCAGLTVVGVLPTHRRRGLLTRLMDGQLREARERGEAISALWASEETIYGRFGYGMTSVTYRMRAKRATAGVRDALRLHGAQARLVDDGIARKVFPRVYRAVARTGSGFIERSREWWDVRVLDDRERRRRGAGPLNQLLLEHAGRPVGYALYRVRQDTVAGEWHKTMRVLEAFGVDAAATLEVWRVLLGTDWVDEIESWSLPADHPLVLGLVRVNDARLTVFDGLWLRLLDVPAALAARSYAGSGQAAIEVVSDPHFPDNVGTWTVAAGEVSRGRRRPDVRLPVAALGAAYLGGFSFRQLAQVGMAEEAARGGLERADALFRTRAQPWCPESF